ncbi:unnamed protein product [Miscanthus lutarioriparius]|uniref:Uncharacterized protein n=1 Tax=Miscanthus lutarioriparius TaxID=422564 RepID=A0A811MAD1_9POAL|nr:unnamed protein product [Miscanthus lutarioriparius]
METFCENCSSNKPLCARLGAMTHLSSQIGPILETKAAPELGSHVSRRQRQDDEDRTAHDAHRFLTLTSEGAGLSRSRITDISQVQSRQTWRQITHRHGTVVCRPRCVVRIQSNRQCLSTWNQGGELTKAGGVAGLVRSDQVSECGLRFRTNDLHGAGGRSISDQMTQEAALGGMGIWDPRTEARGEDEWKLGAATRERCRTWAGAALGSAQEVDLLEDEAGADEGAEGDGERQALAALAT